MPPKPWMDGHHVDLISETLHSFDRPITVVEWGVGRSTIYWCDQLWRDFVEFDWFAVDDKAEYIARADALKCQDWPLTMRWSDDKESYVSAPSMDVAIVDGRHRAACITHARRVMADDGVIFLHDAQRAGYSDVCEGLCGNMVLGVQGELWKMWRP